MPRRPQSIVLFIACLTLAGGLSGCGELGAGESDTVTGITGGEAGVEAAPGLVPQAQPPVDDVPVPIGFKIIEPMSRSFSADDKRKIEHTYQGRADKFDVKRFYARQMPLSGWKLLSEQFVGGEFALSFAKDEELAEVSISSRTTWGRERTTVAVNVRPRPENQDDNN